MGCLLLAPFAAVSGSGQPTILLGKGKRFCGAKIDNEVFSVGSPIDDIAIYDTTY